MRFQLLLQGVLVTGHDLNDLQQLLEQSASAGVDVYTHTAMWVLTAMDPDYVGALTMTLVPGTPMYQDAEAGKFKLITPFESLKELLLIVKKGERQERNIPEPRVRINDAFSRLRQQSQQAGPQPSKAREADRTETALASWPRSPILPRPGSGAPLGQRGADRIAAPRVCRGARWRGERQA